MNNNIYKIINFEKSLIMSPDYLNDQYDNYILEYIKKECENMCLKDIGYIKKIIKIKEIIHDEIMKMTPNINVKVNVEAEVYYPTINDILNIKVELIFNHGIFANFNKLKVLIPIYNCEQYELIQDFSETYLKHKETQKKIKKNDIIEIQLTNIRFEKDNYSCLGKIHC
jgi:DNA-directed RNA polymerase subunit E'/Rpb7